MKLKPVKARILRAAEYLRNPKLKQANGQLRGKDDNKCCLGHLCEMFRKETGRGRWKKVYGQWWFFVGDFGQYGVMTSPVAKWYGLALNPELIVKGRPAAASFHNDLLRRTLPEIADGLEALVVKGKK